MNDGVWYDENSNYKTFQTGDDGELMVAFYDTKRYQQLATYEYKKDKPFQGYPLSGDDFEVGVELLGKHKAKHVLQQHFKFMISAKSLKIKEVK